MIIKRGIRYARANRFGDAILEELPQSLDNIESESILCPQQLSVLGGSKGPDFKDDLMGEDCLRVSVFAPESTDGKLLPVMAWIHGGSFIKGSGEFARYDASTLAEEQGIVVVNISYRVGAFGFLQGIDNKGLRDIEVALLWIKSYIKRFGGDPNDVTACGQSAGALCIAHLISTCKESLFRKAILFSPPLGIYISKSKTKKIRELIENKLKSQGCDLLTSSCSQLLGAQEYAISQSHKMPMPFSTEGLARFPIMRKMNGIEKVLITTEHNDASPFVTKELEPKVTKWLFRVPSKFFAWILRRRGVKASWKEYNWSPEGLDWGACHTLETSLLLGSWESWNRAYMLKKLDEIEYRERCKSMRQEIADFIKTV